jgi:hypothetical protein
MHATIRTASCVPSIRVLGAADAIDHRSWREITDQRGHADPLLTIVLTPVAKSHARSSAGSPTFRA